VIVMPVLYAFRSASTRAAQRRDPPWIESIVVKSTGSADVFGFERAIERAMEEVRNEVLAPPDAAVRTEREFRGGGN